MLFRLFWFGTFQPTGGVFFVGHLFFSGRFCEGFTSCSWWFQAIPFEFWGRTKKHQKNWNYHVAQVFQKLTTQNFGWSGKNMPPWLRLFVKSQTLTKPINLSGPQLNNLSQCGLNHIHNEKNSSRCSVVDPRGFFHCPTVPWSRLSRFFGDGRPPTFNDGNPYFMGIFSPLRTWVDDHPLLYGNNGSWSTLAQLSSAFGVMPARFTWTTVQRVRSELKKQQELNENWKMCWKRCPK